MYKFKATKTRLKPNRGPLTVLQPDELAASIAWPLRSLVRKNLSAIHAALADGATLSEVYEVFKTKLGMGGTYDGFRRAYRREEERAGDGPRPATTLPTAMPSAQPAPPPAEVPKPPAAAPAEPAAAAPPAGEGTQGAPPADAPAKPKRKVPMSDYDYTKPRGWQPSTMTMEELKKNWWH